MFKFGRIFDQVTSAERRKMARVQEIFRKAFCDVAEYADKLPAMVTHRSEQNYEVVLLTAEGSQGEVWGFALCHYHPSVEYAYLDYIASDPDRRARGVGDALYEALRAYLVRKGAKGLFMEVPPDDPAVVKDKALLALNKKRLAFYERFGAFPIEGSSWEEPTPDPELDPPLLVYDPLGRKGPLVRAEARKAARAILTRKYDWGGAEPRTRRMVESFRADPVPIRSPRYLKENEPAIAPSTDLIHPLEFVMAEHHEIHHVRERGYVERPARVESIVAGFKGLPFERLAARHVDMRPIKAVHDKDFVNYLEAACKKLGPDETLYPYVFPIRRPERKPKDRAVRAGYYCIDTFTPLSRSAYAAARTAVDCAMTGADRLRTGSRLVYALCRPPGHHAETRVFGGFCYFNNAAIAAHALSAEGKVAILDIDYHHGNGAQDIFYKRSDVLTVSIHGHPSHAYPYFCGFADERGEGDGKGLNINYPLAEGLDDGQYQQVLTKALKDVRAFAPMWLVVCLGFDTMTGDPTGSLRVTHHGMRAIGTAIGRLGLPTLVVQEGGYALRNLRRGARGFFLGLTEAVY